MAVGPGCGEAAPSACWEGAVVAASGLELARAALAANGMVRLELPDVLLEVVSEQAAATSARL